jgi:hypothetical protein
MTARRALTFHVGVNARRMTGGLWGDTAYAESLVHAFEAKGHEARLFFRDETPDLTGRNDVVLRIIGPHLDEPVAGVPNLLWIISPPNLAPKATLARFATVFVASRRLSSILTEAGLDAEYMPQATDPAIFHPGAGSGDPAQYQVSFVGNLASRAARPALREAIEAGFPVTVWGDGWREVVPASHFGGERLDMAGLAAVYAGSRVVLNSHMPMMSSLGMMSNRTFDALASGAVVLSDRVTGFDDPHLHDLIQTGPGTEFLDALRAALDQPLRDMAARIATAQVVAEQHGFDQRAERFITVARTHLKADNRARPAFCPLAPAPVTGEPASLHLTDRGPAGDALASPSELVEMLDDALRSQALDLTLHLGDATEQQEGLTGQQIVHAAALAVLRIGAVLERRGRLARFTVERSGEEARTGVIHPMMTDHLEAQEIACQAAQSPDDPALHAALLRLMDRARRVEESLGDGPAEFGLGLQFRNRPASLVRAMNNRPLFAHAPEGYDRDKEKPHLLLWPRAHPPVIDRPIGVFLHLFHTDIASLFAERLARLALPHSVYISTDTLEKAAALTLDFPQAEIRVLPNRGRDVWPKLFGFADRHADHDLVLHLHGKKSTHAAKLDNWLDLVLNCLLPSGPEINRIVSLFQSVPSLGIVAPLTHRAVLGAAHWGDNLELAQEIARRMGLTQPLPGNDALQFPVGSMFWARRAVLQPLLDLGLRAENFPPEEGQVDATPAHAIERLYGVVCAAAGAHLIRVAPQGSGAHRAHQIRCKRNGDLREALDKGLLGG